MMINKSTFGKNGRAARKRLRKRKRNLHRKTAPKFRMNLGGGSAAGNRRQRRELARALNRERE